MPGERIRLILDQIPPASSTTPQPLAHPCALDPTQQRPRRLPTAALTGYKCRHGRSIEQQLYKKMTSAPSPKTRPTSSVLSPALRRLLTVVLALFGLLVVNSLYLVSLTLAGQVSDRVEENYFYLLMFLGHLGLGLLMTVPALVFGALHLRRAWRWRRHNRYAVRAGIALYLTAILVLGSGILLTRFGFFEVNDPLIRSAGYWLHVLAPLVLIWLFILHRLAGPPLHWRRGMYWGGAGAVFTAAALGLHLFYPQTEPEVARPFLPALVQSEADQRIPAAHLSTDALCGECHADILRQLETSMHRLSSFNNPAYRFSVDEARRVILERDGDVLASQFCAGCHDPVPLMSGRFSEPDYDPEQDPASQAGITCMTCHAISRVNSPRGNADYTLLDPPRYPFAFSDNALLRAVNRQLIKAKPAFHKRTLLKPVHKSAEFCSTCHKVHLPYALNHYRWLRGQNHYDSFLLSGVSGHRVDSFYYPPRAVKNCSHCHMPLVPSDDPAARDLDGSGRRSVHDHRFAAANTAVPVMVGRPEQENEPRRERLAKAARVDIFGIREAGSADGPLLAPLRPALPQLQPGKRYVLETVVRTLGMGHEMTQGTADSNELWLDVTVRSGERLIGRSGALQEAGEVDPWAYFLNAYVLDRHGNRVDRRNAQDIFVALYNHQIPPGAAAVVHYALTLPPDAGGPLSIEAKLQYRKFDTRYLRYIEGDRFDGNSLPITTLARDRVTLPLAAGRDLPSQSASIPAWERWNDYGIGLLRQGNQGANKGQLREATAAFERVEALGRPEGPMNLARVYYKEGRLEETAAVLRRAAAFDPPPPPWTLAWYSALVEREQGHLDRAVGTLEALIDTRFHQATERGFDFGRDYRVLNELGRILFERARQERGAARREARLALLEKAGRRFEEVLAADPENLTAHYNLALINAELDRPEAAARHRDLHEKYRPDDQAIERAVTVHRQRNPVADHAAEPGAVYDLQRSGNPALEAEGFVPVPAQARQETLASW
jgi:tetratricopeptide (TPR) repeat protein